MTGGYASMPKEFGERCLSEISVLSFDVLFQRTVPGAAAGSTKLTAGGMSRDFVGETLGTGWNACGSKVLTNDI